MYIGLEELIARLQKVQQDSIKGGDGSDPCVFIRINGYEKYNSCMVKNEDIYYWWDAAAVYIYLDSPVPP